MCSQSQYFTFYSNKNFTVHVFLKLKKKMNLLFCFVVFAGICSTYGNPIKSDLQKDKPYDSCVCETFSCACCTTLFVPQIGINDTACISFAYLPKDYGISLVLEIDDSVLINETISARNPPPVCLPIPYIEDFVDVCVHFTDLKITNNDFHGCASLEARMWWVYVVAEFSLGCWDTSSVPSKEVNVKFVSANSTKPISDGFVVGNTTKPLEKYLKYKAVHILKDMNKLSVKDLHTNKI